MRAAALSREEMEANHARYAMANRVAGLLDDAPPPAANHLAVRSLTGEDIWFRGRLYWIRPVPYPDGVAHAALMWQLERVRQGDAGDIDVLELLRRNARLIRRHTRPVAWWGWLPWWLRPDPFRDATEVEMGELSAHFTLARTRSHVRSLRVRQKKP